MGLQTATKARKWPGARCVKDRNGDPRYWYVKPLDGGAEIRISADYRTAEWEREYLAARGGTAPPLVRKVRGGMRSPADMTLSEAVETYLSGPDYKNLAEATQKGRRLQLRRLAKRVPDAILSDLDRLKLFNLLSDMTPLRHRQHVISVRMLYRFFALPNPTQDYVFPKPIPSKGFRAWKEDHIAAFRAHWPLGTLERTILELAYHTCQRKSDLIKMRWSDIVDLIGEDGRVCRAIHVLSQEKTKATVLVPISDELLEALDAWQKSLERRVEERATQYENWVPSARRKGAKANAQREASGDFILRSNRIIKALNSESFAYTMKNAIVAAGLPTYSGGDATFERVFSTHGLRKSGMNAIAEAGGNTLQIMSISGHTSHKNVDHYVKDMEKQRAAIRAVQLRQAHTEKQKAKPDAAPNVVPLERNKPRSV